MNRMENKKAPQNRYKGFKGVSVDKVTDAEACASASLQLRQSGEEELGDRLGRLLT